MNPACGGDDCKIEYGYSSIGTRYVAGDTPVLFRKNIFSGISIQPPSILSNGWKTPEGIRTHLALVSAESDKPIGTTSFRYCRDVQGRYRIDCDSSMQVTPYYGFLLVQPLKAS